MCQSFGVSKTFSTAFYLYFYTFFGKGFWGWLPRLEVLNYHLKMSFEVKNLEKKSFGDGSPSLLI